VTGVDDPRQRGRVEVTVPAVTRESLGWAIVLAQGGRPFTPAPGDEVMVAFEAGDLALPIVLGTLWDGSKKPPEQRDK
jgi:hypothetical protein